MGIASWRLGPLLAAFSCMSCLVTDKIEFEVVPPNVYASSPPGLSFLPSVPDPNCSPSGIQMTARYFNAQGAENDLEVRVLANGRLVSSDEEGIPSSPTTGLYQFCVPFEPNLSTGASCYEIELFVSHGFTKFIDGVRPATPLVEGDIDSITWYLAVAPDENAEPTDLWEACRRLADEPTTLTLEPGLPVPEAGAGQ